MIPWDLDNAYIDDWMWGMSWSSPRAYIAQYCWADPTCHEAQRAAVLALADEVDAVDWGPEIDRWDQLTRPFVESDPRRECIDDESSRTLVRGWMDTEPGVVRALWGG